MYVPICNWWILLTFTLSWNVSLHVSCGRENLIFLSCSCDHPSLLTIFLISVIRQKLFCLFQVWGYQWLTKMESPCFLLPGGVGLTINVSQGGAQQLLGVGSQQGCPMWDGWAWLGSKGMAILSSRFLFFSSLLAFDVHCLSHFLVGDWGAGTGDEGLPLTLLVLASMSF